MNSRRIQFAPTLLLAFAPSLTASPAACQNFPHRIAVGSGPPFVAPERRMPEPGPPQRRYWSLGLRGIDNTGAVHFDTNIPGTTSSDDYWISHGVASPDGTVDIWVEHGTTAEGISPSELLDFSWRFTDRSGRSFADLTYQDRATNARTSRLIERARDGSLAVLAQSGQPVPAFGPDAVFQYVDVRQGSCGIPVTLSGTVTTADGTRMQAIFQTTGFGTMDLIFGETLPAPANEPGLVFVQLYDATPTVDGSILLVADASPTPDEPGTDHYLTGIWRAAPDGTIERLAFEGQPSPLSADGSIVEDIIVDGKNCTFFSMVTMIEHGADGTPREPLQAVLLPNGQLRAIARRGDVLPDGSIFEETLPWVGSANRRGDLYFETMIAGEPASAWVLLRDGGLRRAYAFDDQAPGLPAGTLWNAPASRRLYAQVGRDSFLIQAVNDFETPEGPVSLLARETPEGMRVVASSLTPLPSVSGPLIPRSFGRRDPNVRVLTDGRIIFHCEAEDAQGELRDGYWVHEHDGTFTAVAVEGDPFPDGSSEPPTIRFANIGSQSISDSAANLADWVNDSDQVALSLTFADNQGKAIVVYDLRACPADTNNDGVVNPADFNAWVIAFNNQTPSCDQNSDGLCNPADFNSWVLNLNAGC
ncbi:MAG: GC-type dockerin domain-anchored protein [Planctomycetota bacterium]